MHLSDIKDNLASVNVRSKRRSRCLGSDLNLFTTDLRNFKSRISEKSLYSVYKRISKKRPKTLMHIICSILYIHVEGFTLTGHCMCHETGEQHKILHFFQFHFFDAVFYLFAN